MRNFLLILSLISVFFLTSLSVEAREVNISDIEPHIKKFLVNHYKPLYKGDIVVDCGRMPGVPFNVEDGKLEIKINSVLRDEFRQRTVVRVSVYVDGKFQRALGVPVTMALYDKVWVATQPIQRDDALSAANIQVERRDISRLANTYAKAITDLTNTRVKKTFNAGDIIDHRFVEKDPIVVRNALVEVIFQSKTISIAIPAQAMENGHIGDIIRVKSDKFNKEYIGKVIDRGVVLVNI
ncbi:MAG: flagellar basal body P-ring formation chaperone FlgA [Cyanobacteriota bacterium]